MMSLHHLLKYFEKFQGVPSITLLIELTEVFMSIEMLDKNTTLKECTEQRLTTKHCMHAEISRQHTQNLLLLAKSN